MKRLLMNATGLLAMVALAPPDIDRGLNASLNWEDEQKAKAGGSIDLPTATSTRTRTLQDSLKAMAAGEGGVADLSMLGLSGKAIAVHKKDAEGVCLVDAFSGRILPNQQDLPEWVTGLGLVAAVLGERHIHYSAKLGPYYTPEMRMPEALAFEDLDWMAINPETGADTLIEADAEFRMEVLAGVLGADRETGAIEGATATVEVPYDNSRTGEEMQAFTEAGGRIFATEEQRQQAAAERRGAAG